MFFTIGEDIIFNSLKIINIEWEKGYINIYLENGEEYSYKFSKSEFQRLCEFLTKGNRFS